MEEKQVKLLGIIFDPKLNTNTLTNQVEKHQRRCGRRIVAKKSSYQRQGVLFISGALRATTVIMLDLRPLVLVIEARV